MYSQSIAILRKMVKEYFRGNVQFKGLGAID
jgi:hypothetical protein